VAVVETPGNFTTSRAVGAWIGLTPRRYQSGEVDYDGHISRREQNRSPAVVIRSRPIEFIFSV
jgi:transposase